MKSNDLSGKLDRFKDLIGHQATDSTPPKTPSRYLKMANTLGGQLCHEPDGTFCLVKRQYDRDYSHGTPRLDALSLSNIPIAAFSATDEPGEVDMRSLVFFDTETTGLGGAGAVAFLIGCGSFEGESFEVRQYVIPDYGDEAAMLEALQLEFGKDKTLVTYNGKAFDVPLVQDRMIINRVGRQIILNEHIDLLHATRSREVVAESWTVC